MVPATLTGVAEATRQTVQLHKKNAEVGNKEIVFGPDGVPSGFPVNNAFYRF